MTREKIIEKFKENAEKIPNKWGEVCWVFIDENFEEIADELLALFEQEKKEVVKKFVAWYKEYLEHIQKHETELLYDAFYRDNLSSIKFRSGTTDVLNRLLLNIDKKLEEFLEENKNEK